MPHDIIRPVANNGLLIRLGIVRSSIKKDLLYFFVPWLTVLCLELLFIEEDKSAGIWQTIWSVLMQPQSLLMFPVEKTTGLFLFIIGFTLLCAGQLTLWRNYSSFVVIHKDHQLVRHGLYRFTRNPMYLGFIIAVIGLPIYASSLYGFLTSLVFIPIMLNRIRLEEALLAEAFGDSFQKYKKTTRKLIPFIY